MTAWHNRVFDDGLNWAQSTVDRFDICSQEPTTFTEATSTYSLGDAAVTLGAAEDGDTDGRKCVVPAITYQPVDASGTATHGALTGATGSFLVATADLTSSQVVAAGNEFSVAAWDLTIRDPS